MVHMTEGKVNGAWLEYKLTGSQRALETLLTTYEPIAEKQERRIRAVFSEKSGDVDFQFAKFIALMDAIDRYVPKPEMEFETFAHSHVRMILLDALGYYRGGIKMGVMTAKTLNSKQKKYYGLFIHQMPKRERLILILSIVEGLNHGEIAEVLETDEREVEGTYNGLLGRLKVGLMMLY